MYATDTKNTKPIIDIINGAHFVFLKHAPIKAENVNVVISSIRSCVISPESNI